MNDPYSILEVPKTASQDEIKKAYRKLARKYHPDMNQGKADAEAKFKEVGQAYDLVGTEEKRKKFDEGGDEAERQRQYQQQWQEQQAQRGPYYHQSGGGQGRYASDFSEEDLFSMFGQRQPRERPSRDLKFELAVSLREAALGGDREVEFPGGRKIQIKIPAGVREGQTIRLKGLGEKGEGATGDALITLHITKSDKFTANGNDIESELSISFVDAVLGGDIVGDVIDGRISVKIPPNTNSGQRVRVRGKGAVDPSTKQRGDHYFVTKMVLPQNLDGDLTSAIRAWTEKTQQSAAATGAV